LQEDKSVLARSNHAEARQTSLHSEESVGSFVKLDIFFTTDVIVMLAVEFANSRFYVARCAKFFS